MHLHNALSRSTELFQPAGPDVTVYVCGITPYDTTHLGHAFTYAVFDVLVRFLEFQGQRVRYAQNVTDIDDDILRKAREVGEDWRELGNRWTRYFIEDLRALNLRPPDYYPRATDVIPQIITAVEQLLARGVAYEVAGNVYFQVSRWPSFGRLSRIPPEEMLPIANERGNVPDDPHKRHPLDFVLWQAHKPGEPAWDSPWGAGRPGWHIECSTMSSHYLGQTIDVHGGGADLIFPHHEAESGQIEPVTGQRFVRFWMHAAMVYHQGEKMSKSLGNLVMVRDLLRSYAPDALRLYLAAHHYRNPWSFDAAELHQAAGLAAQLRDAVQVAGGGGELDPGPAETLFLAALEDDLNTPDAISALEALADDILAAAELRRDVRRAQAALRSLGSLLGLRLDASEPEARVVEGWNRHLQRFI